MARDYRREALRKRTRSHGDVAVDASLIVGVVVEQALTLQFSPARGSLPVLLSHQTHDDHREVRLSNVLVGESRQVRHGVRVLVHAKDAALALDITKQIVRKLEGPLLDLECLAADHVNDTCLVRGSTIAHDLIAKFRSPQGRGLVSVEIKLREVQQRKPHHFNWQDTLEAEARPLWDAELAMNRRYWHSRILVLAELGRPCHTQGLQGLHMSRIKTTGDWETLCGWHGFWPRARGGAAEAPRPPPPSAANRGPALQRPRRQIPKLDYRCVHGKMVAPIKHLLKCPRQPGRACEKLLRRRPRVVTEEELFQVPRQGAPPGGRAEWVGTAKAAQLLFLQEGR